MEITSFILGVCAVIVLLMIVGTSVNYMAIKVLRKEIDTLSQDIKFNRSSMIREFDTVKANYMHHIKKAIDYTDQLNNNAQDEMNTIYKTIDSRADKLDNKLNKDVESLIRELNILQQEISRVERGYKEKINY
jgi:predicted PurR-regulated permease PerM